MFAVLCAVPGFAAQGPSVYRFAGLDFTLSGSLAINYSSNVDQAYPEEEKENYSKDDFYLVPSLTLSAAPVRLNPKTSLSFGATAGYEKYFERKDLDTETYAANIALSSALRYLSLNAAASVERSTENSEDETYKPGGYSRDPQETQDVSFGATWAFNRLTVAFTTDYNRERHDYEEYKSSDQDEFTWDLNVNFALSSWFSAYYTHSYDWTHTILDDTKETEIEDDFGIAFNGSFGRHPQITASVAMEKETGNKIEDGKDWKPVFNLSITDAYDITKYLSVAAGLSWSDDKEEDEVSFTYNASITHRLPPYITQSLAFSCEPLDTFGSDAETESTTFTYSLGINPFFIKGLSFNGSAEYAIDKPLDKSSPTERTTTFNAGLSHARALSRKLSRTLSYNYTWENSNFHHDGANIENLVTYQLNYLF
ncbi:MAG: hypothetical protein IK066_10500 [Kiritimatiellae bacterium]|nr:hypothetical protein [Kiritimatiellia bacterium]